MTVSNLREWLIRHKACQEALDWVGTKTFKEVWDTCTRPDWLSWLLHTAMLDKLENWPSTREEIVAIMSQGICEIEEDHSLHIEHLDAYLRDEVLYAPLSLNIACVGQDYFGPLAPACDAIRAACEEAD